MAQQNEEFDQIDPNSSKALSTSTILSNKHDDGKEEVDINDTNTAKNDGATVKSDQELNPGTG